MKQFAQIILVIALFFQVFGTVGTHAQSAPPAIVVTGQTAGPTPFISFLSLEARDAGTLKSVAFEVVPKPGSVTKPVSAVYYADHLESRGDFDALSGQVRVPVFGLYADYLNTVNLTYRFTDGTSQQDHITVATAKFDDPNGYTRPTVLHGHTGTPALSYGFFMIKNYYGPHSPILMDTDGQVRWVGTTGPMALASVFYQNSFFVPASPAGSSALTAVARMEFDGSVSFLRDYSDLGVALVAHHNFDPGKDGFLAEVDTTTELESVIYELDTVGNPLRSWDLAAIISAAMTAGGDDPSQFVLRPPLDWFHNNAATYRRSDDSLIVSSRENFVVCVDYDSGALKWILGDPTKRWYQFPSLRKYALDLPPGSLPPIGQHAVSITPDDHLLLFDNGANSRSQAPAGEARTYSTPREYRLDLEARTATEVWNYPRNESIQSSFTSSVYEDDLGSYLIDYANVGPDNMPTYAEFIGLGSSGEIAFDYAYPVTTYGLFAWNCVPIHLENLVFTGPASSLAAGHAPFFTGETRLENGVYFLDFPANGNAFGSYSYLADPHYIYHYGLGYEYVFDNTDSRRGVYLYDFASRSFFYTSPDFPFPYLYDFSLGAVLYYYFDPSNPREGATRYFFNFATGQIITK